MHSNRRNDNSRRFIKALVTAVLGLLVVATVALHATGNPTTTTLTTKRFTVTDEPAVSSSASEEIECDSIPKGLTRDQQCDFVLAHCEPDGLFDYLKFRYCQLNHPLIAVIFSVGVLFVWLLCLFYMLSESAEAHFCPMLSEISSTLRMSPDLAGITILAFGNGSPDVFSSIAAIQADNFSILMGALLGAGCFITHVIVGIVGVINKARVKRYPFVRDLLFYLVGLGFIFGMLWDGRIMLWEAICFFLYYVIYVCLATAVHVWNARRGKAIMVTKAPSGEGEPPGERTPLVRKRASSFHLIKVPALPAQPAVDQSRGRSSSHPPPPTAAAVAGDETSMPEPVEHPIVTLPSGAASVNADANPPVVAAMLPAGKSPKPTLSPSRTPRTLAPPVAATAAAGASPSDVEAGTALKPRRYDDLLEFQHKQARMMRHGLAAIVQGWREIPGPDIEHVASAHKEGDSTKKKSILAKYLDFVEWEEKGLFGKIVHCIMIPFSTLMHLSVPHADDEGYNKWLLAISFSLSPIIFFFAMGQDGLMIAGKVPVWAVVVAGTAVIGILIAVFAPKEGLPRPLQFTIILYSFVISMMWMYIVAQEAVALLQSMSVMFGISPTIVGITVMSWGNCIGDFVADVTVTRQGYPDMAIAATYAGPLFNMLVGIGIGATIYCVRTGSPYHIELNDMMLIGFGYLMTALVFSLVFITIRRFSVDRILGLVLLMGYLVFMLLSFLVEFGVIKIFQ